MIRKSRKETDEKREDRKEEKVERIERHNYINGIVKLETLLKCVRLRVETKKNEVPYVTQVFIFSFLHSHATDCRIPCC